MHRNVETKMQKEVGSNNCANHIKLFRYDVTSSGKFVMMASKVCEEER